MGSELVSGSNPPLRGNVVAPTSLSEIFREHLPFYLSIGMTWDQYWNQDCTMTIYYRKAFELQKERLNQKLWLQGAYVYEAIGDLVPVLHAFAKKNAKPHPYPAEPYAITVKMAEEKREREAEAEYDRKRARVASWAAAINKKFEKKEMKTDGNDS